MNKKDFQYAEGMSAKIPPKSAPNFLKMSIAIKVDDFVDWVQDKKNDRGYVNIDVKESKKGNIYCELNTFTGNKQKKVSDTTEKGDDERGIPIF